VTAKGGVIEGSGMKLTIPKDAIPCSEVTGITVSVQACIGGPVVMPDGHHLVSPIYLAQPPFAFHKDITLEVELFAEVRKKEDLLFITSPSKPTMENEIAEWKFKVGNRKPSHHESKNVGVMKLRHFCLFALSGLYMNLLLVWNCNQN